MLVGYAGVTIRETNLGPIVDALEQVGCAGNIYLDLDVGSEKCARRELARAIGAGRAGDTLVVTRLDRLANGPDPLLETCLRIAGAGLHLRSIEDGLDTAVHIDFVNILRSVVHLFPPTSLGCMAARAASSHIETQPLGRADGITEAVWEDIKNHLARGISVASIARYHNQRPQAIYYKLRKEAAESDYMGCKTVLSRDVSPTEVIEDPRLFPPAIEYYSRMRRRGARGSKTIENRP